MKNPNRETVTRLEDLPNIGKAVASDLKIIGIRHPKNLIGQNPFALYSRLCKATAVKQDPCMLDVIMSAVDFMEGGAPRPWWSYTGERKRLLAQKKNE